MRRTVAATLLVLALAVPAAAEMDGFRSPSGNIHCMFYSEGNSATLRCDILETSNRPPKPPADCDLDWGNAFEMTGRSSKARRICHGDTVASSDNRVLSYGKSWQRGGFTCTSAQSGVSCRNKRGAGWDLSRSSQTLH